MYGPLSIKRNMLRGKYFISDELNILWNQLVAAKDITSNNNIIDPQGVIKVAFADIGSDISPTLNQDSDGAEGSIIKMYSEVVFLMVILSIRMISQRTM